MLGKKVQAGAKKKVAFRATGRQLEASVHTSLPPLVQGALRAYVRVCVSAIVWEYSIGPPASKLCVALKWWGERSPGTVFRVPVVCSEKNKLAGESTTLAYYPVRSALSQLKAYLKDLKALKLLVGLGHMTEDSMVIGRCTLPDLSVLSETRPYEDSIPIISPQGHTLGNLQIQIEIQVARAGQTRLSAPAVDASQPGFTVGPGATVKAKRQDLQEVGTERGSKARQSRGLDLKVESTNPSAGTLHQTAQSSLQAAADHKAALLAKYTQQRTEPGARRAQSDYDDEREAMEIGPQQREVISELIERGEKLREAMVVSVFKTRQGGVGGGVQSTGRDYRSTENQKEFHTYNSCSSDEEKEGEEAFSMDESDYPLRDPSLLEQLLYSSGVHTTTELKKKEKSEAAVQTLSHSPSPPPSTAAPPASSHYTPPSSHPPSDTRTDDGARSQMEDTGSLTTLASFFSGQSLQNSIDTEILQAVGMERLTLLGRVTSTRVVVERLVVDPGQLATAVAHRGKTRSSHSVPAPPTSGTFFVEYHFPAPLARGGGARGRRVGRGRAFPPPHEVVRVASRKIKNGVVQFGHRSVFPVSLVGQTTRQWWHDVLVFSVYFRPPTDRSPLLLGKARVPFRQRLMARSSASRVEVEVQRSVVGADCGGTVADTETDNTTEITVGKLTVSVQLLCGQGHELQGGETAVTDRAESERGGERERKGSGKWSQAPPVRVKEKATVITKDIDKQPSPLQLLLMIPEGTDLGLPKTNASEPSIPPQPGVPPNSYLVCRLFCASPHPKTTTMWATPNPQFNFRQVYTLYLTPSLLEQVCNNFTVVEVWHKTPGTNSDDELLGLVKLSLHQFYLAFSEESSTSLCLHAELPVIAVDSYCPVISPFTGNEQGNLAVLLAMGSAQQISILQQQFATGSYVLQQPYGKAQRPEPLRAVAQQTQIGTGALNEDNHQQNSGPIHHTFDVTVSGVRGLAVFNNTVWGEADCFVQYHFPSKAQELQQQQQQGEEREGEEVGGSEYTINGGEVGLQPCRTDLTLCVPNPSFTQETRHSLSLPRAHPVQRVIMRACGGSGGVPFELWQRFYYPNIRDQLIAKASLPLAKLCALVSMQRMAGPNVQSFSLPMQLITQEAQGQSGGILEVTVQYQALQDGHPHFVVDESQKKSHIILSVEILRATGLKDAAILAAQEHPVPLGFTAEVGTNSYARISFPDLLDKDKRTTKTVARSFAPDFCHSFDFALPLISREAIHPYTLSTSLAQRLAECSAVIEIWHRVPKNDARPAPRDGKVFGRRLAPAFKDVCLGHARLPLIRLLEKHTGVHGWFPLFPPIHSSDTHDSAPGQIGNPDPNGACSYVGGVEVSLSLANKDDRKLILARGLDMGWKIPQGSGINMDYSDQPTQPEPRQEGRSENVGGGCLKHPVCWKFDVKLTELWVSAEAVAIPLSEDPAPYMYCFVRYRFFNSATVVSLPKALSYCREGRGCYQLNHHARVTLLGSRELEWYVGEDSMEVEVWSCPTRRRHSEGSDRGPGSDDTLLGTVSISLQALSSKDTISGYYPVFKAREVSLGSQVLTAEIKKSVTESGEPRSEADDLNIALEILDTPSDEDRFVPLKPVSDGDETGEGESEEGQGPGEHREEEKEEEDAERFKDMFEARLVIHQALHLPMMTDKSQQNEWPPCAYVTLHPHPRVDKIVTEAIPNSQTPLWNHQCLTHLPNLYLDPHCPGLEFQVWSKVSGLGGSASSEEDSYIGCAHIDLSTLAFGLAQISGWYNITDFGGQVQGQLKVSITPSQRIGFPAHVSSCPLPCSHVMISTPSILAQPSEPATASPPFASGTPQTESAQPVPSFMERSSSILFRKLRDDLHELDQINSSLKARVQVLTAPPDQKSLCHQLITQVPTSLSPSTSIATTTTTASLSLDYSSSGPTLDHYSHTDSAKEEADAEKLANIRVHTLEREASSSTKKDFVESHEMISDMHEVQETYSRSSSCSSSRSLSISPERLEENPSTSVGLFVASQTHRRIPSETSSLHVQVESPPPTPSGELARVVGGHESSRSPSLTDVSTCSSRDDSPVTSSSPLAASRVAERQSGIAVEGRKTTEPVLAAGRAVEGETEVTAQTGAMQLVGMEIAQTLVTRHYEKLPEPPGSTAPTQQPDTHVDVEVGRQRNESIPENAANNPPAELPSVVPSSLSTRPPSTQSKPSPVTASATTVSGATTDQLRLQEPLTHSSSVQVPEVRLPNFFMPPQELERTMRTLRASAMCRPPPRYLFGGHSPPQDQVSSTLDSQAAASSGVHTLQDVSQFLKSRRVSSDAHPQALSGRKQELSFKDTERLARIFASRPLQSHSEN